MGARPWYKRYGADFVHGTLGLSLEEKGAYSLCLDLIYDRGGAIPDDARWLAGVCGVSVRKWNALRSRLIETGKLFEGDGVLTNKRAEKEIEKAAKTARKHAENGAKGGIKSAQTRDVTSNNNNLDEATLDHTCATQKLEARVITSNNKSCPKARKRVSYPERFDEFWKGYPTDANMAKKEAFVEWQRLGEEDRDAAVKSLPGFIAYCRKNPDYRPIHACRYLKNERFEGHLEGAKEQLHIASMVEIRRGTPPYDAWNEYRKRRGKPKIPVERWQVESEWPPDHPNHQSDAA